MEIIKNIHRRRSVRKFNNKPISQEDIKTILSAGMTAPSAMNKQPWRFILIDDDDYKDEIADFSYYAQMCKDSPLSILICEDTDVSYFNYGVMDCSACIQNILLASRALEIGSVWVGILEEQENIYRKIFDLPENIKPHSVVVLGYSDVEIKEKNYFDESKIHYNKW